MKKLRRVFRPLSRFFSEMIQDRTTVTVELQLELVRDLLNGAISGAVTLSDN